MHSTQLPMPSQTVPPSSQGAPASALAATHAPLAHERIWQGALDAPQSSSDAHSSAFGVVVGAGAVVGGVSVTDSVVAPPPPPAPGGSAGVQSRSSRLAHAAVAIAVTIPTTTVGRREGAHFSFWHMVSPSEQDGAARP